MADRVNIDVLKELNIAYENQSTERINDSIDTVLKLVLRSNPDSDPGNLGNFFSVFSNYLRIIVKNKNANPNTVLSSVLKHGQNYIALFMIGMLIKNGANPNVYFPVKGYGNLHILCALALRSQGGYDPYFRMLCNVMRIMGSDINYSAYNYGTNEGLIDVNFVEKVVDSAPEGQYGRPNLTVKDFILEMGKIPNEDIPSFFNSLSTEDLLHVIIATDKVDLLKRIMDSNLLQIIKENAVNTTKFYINLSTANASNIASEMTQKDFPLINTLVNGQPIPLYASTSAMDEELFGIYIKKGSLIKYLTINHLIIYYKYFKKEDIKLYRNNYYMLLEAVSIGADIDVYQFDLFVSAADYDEVENIKTAYQVPKWKKLCSVVQEKPRQELKQMAFELNLDYNMSEDRICNKLKQISLIDKNDYFESAVKRQEERISADTASSEEYVGNTTMTKSRCSNKTTILKNPYAYNDARMAFYKDPKDGEIWCFTSDMFTSLLASKVNPYNGNPLPLKFVETIKAQVNILKELGVYDVNRNIRDALKEIYERSVINNIKTEYAYNTVVKCLSLFGVSEERFSTLKTITQEDTILREICGVRIKHFDYLTPRQKIMTTARVIYSLSKSNNENPTDLYREIARVITGYEDMPQEDNFEAYLNM